MSSSCGGGGVSSWGGSGDSYGRLPPSAKKHSSSGKVVERGGAVTLSPQAYSNKCFPPGKSTEIGLLTGESARRAPGERGDGRPEQAKKRLGGVPPKPSSERSGEEKFSRSETTLPRGPCEKALRKKGKRVLLFRGGRVDRTPRSQKNGRGLGQTRDKKVVSFDQRMAELLGRSAVRDQGSQKKRTPARKRCSSGRRKGAQAASSRKVWARKKFHSRLARLLGGGRVEVGKAKEGKKSAGRQGACLGTGEEKGRRTIRATGIVATTGCAPQKKKKRGGLLRREGGGGCVEKTPPPRRKTRGGSSTGKEQLPLLRKFFSHPSAN